MLQLNRFALIFQASVSQKQKSVIMLDLDQQILSSWCQERGIDLMILFGSQATGKTKARSDVDIALSSRTAPLRENVIRLYGEMEDLFQQEVDVAIIDAVTDPVLLLEIFQKGKALYEAKPGLFFEQKIRAFRIFEDTEPLRRFRDAVLARRVQEMKNVPAHR